MWWFQWIFFSFPAAVSLFQLETLLAPVEQLSHGALNLNFTSQLPPAPLRFTNPILQSVTLIKVECHWGHITPKFDWNFPEIYISSRTEADSANLCHAWHPKPQDLSSASIKRLLPFCFFCVFVSLFSPCERKDKLNGAECSTMWKPWWLFYQNRTTCLVDIL